MKNINKLYILSICLFQTLFSSNLFAQQDKKLAPNSYIFDINTNYDGLEIPVAKAYKMWDSNPFYAATSIPNGVTKAYVYWEDEHGLIKTNANYELTMVGSGETAIIKVPVNKHKEGNALISLEVDGTIYWSWHVWVTDDPTQNGSSYISYSTNGVNIKKKLNDGTLVDIQPADWKWMDRNLGATSAKLTGSDWIRNSGLLYQWGRKDPIPPLALKGEDFYEVSGKVGRVRHGEAKSWQNGAVSIDNLILKIRESQAKVNDNIQKATKNPLSLIYVIKNESDEQAIYNNLNNPLNWFGNSTVLSSNRLSELNLWSDNLKGAKVNLVSINYESAKGAYHNKSEFDPCPNGWRVPSMLVTAEGNSNYTDNVRSDYAPLGYKVPIENFNINNVIKPTNFGMNNYQNGIKVYGGIGYDLTNTNGHNMGVFPGTGAIYRNSQDSQLTDQHETFLWTATMTRWFEESHTVNARAIRMIPDHKQTNIPDASLPQVTGKFEISNTKDQTSNAYAVRCVKDQLHVLNNYDFPTNYYTESTALKYDIGMDEPNTYTREKSSSEIVMNIPINKPFSVQSNLMDNPEILQNTSFNNLKVNVKWTTNTNLISGLSLVGQPTSLAEISASSILAKINPNQSGNAIISLHNEDINNPVLWSWHIWITNTPLQSLIYQNDVNVNNAVTNYVNYVKNGTVMLTELMDRNLGALDMVHFVSDPNNMSADDIQAIKNSGGMQYQWGRKDPLPSFTNPDGSTYQLYLGNNNGSTINYTPLSNSEYANHIKDYNTYSSIAGVEASDPISARIAKVLKYATNNPLEFLTPSSFAPAAGLDTNGADWLSESSEPNLGADRWGRGGKKSPFDPCPEGWRVPDVYFSSTTFQLSTLPWSLVNVDATAPNPLVGTYSATVQNRNVLFRNSNYKIGNIPFVGIRGWRNVLQGGAPDYEASARYTGLWTAALASNYNGRAVGLLIDKSANNLIPYSPGVDPYFAMNCRCVKIRIHNGEEIGPILKDQVTEYPAGTGYNDTLYVTEVSPNAKEVSIKVYPNPFIEKVTVDSHEMKISSTYQIFDLGGKQVGSGIFNIKTDVNFSELPSGMYIIKIKDVEKSFKVIKK